MWRQMIIDVGIQKIADETGVTYAAVRRYVMPGGHKLQAIPRENLRPLCKAMAKHLDRDRFCLFMNSLSEELTGYPMQPCA